MPWRLGTSQYVPSRYYYARSIRGRGGGAKWYIARYYEVHKGNSRYGIIEISPLNIQTLTSLGYSHRSVVKCRIVGSSLIISNTGEHRRIRTGVFKEHGYDTFEAKIYFTRKRIRSTGLPAHRDYRPLYGNVLIRLPQLSIIYKLLASIGIVNHVYLELAYSKNDLVLRKI